MDRIHRIIKEGFSVTINWNFVLAFICFWSYGFFGYFSKESFFSKESIGLVDNILLTILTLFIFLFFLFLGLKNKGKTYTVTPEILVVFSSYFLIFLILSWENLTNPVNGDHFGYIQHAKAHSFFIVEKISHIVPSFNNVPFWFMVWCVDIIFIVSFIAGWLVLKRYNRYLILVVTGTLFIFLRGMVIYQGGNPDPFPAFGLFPIWLSSVFFPGTDFGFRLAVFFPFIVFVTCVYYFSRSYFSKRIAWLFGFLLGTIPVFWHVATIVEFSLWTAMGWAMFLFWLIIDKERKLISLQTLVVILVVCSSIRISGPAALILVFALVFFNWCIKKINVREALAVMIPCLVLLPIILQNHYVGSPAAYAGAPYLNLGIIQNASLFERIKISFLSDVSINAILNTFILPYVVITGLLPILLLLKKKYIQFLVVVSFFCIAYIVFYSIEPWLWGNGRYQAEFIFPFLAASLLLCLIFIKNNILKTCFIVLGIGLNLFSFYTMHSRNEGWYGYRAYFPQAKIRGAYSIESEYPIDYKRALNEASVAGYEGKTYYPGYLYLLSNLSGYSVKNVLREKDIMNTVGASLTTSTAITIHKNKNIQAVFIPMYQKEIESTEEHVYESLKRFGWVDWKELYDPVYKNTIRGLKRK